MRSYGPWLMAGILLTTFAALGYGFVASTPGITNLGELENDQDACEYESRRAEELEAARRALRGRLQARQHILQAVLEQQLTLLKAAGQFRDLDRSPEAGATRDCLRWSFVGHSDEERYCRMVFALAREQAQRQGLSAEVVARLEDQLQGYLRHARRGRSSQATEA